jgi:hypothetical protein
MPLVRVSKFTHAFLTSEIDRRRKAGELPKPTYESIIQEMTCDRSDKRARDKKEKKA